MVKTLLKYELTQEEVQYLLSAIQSVPHTGIPQAEMLINMTNKLNVPVNLKELQEQPEEGQE